MKKIIYILIALAALILVTGAFDRSPKKDKFDTSVSETVEGGILLPDNAGEVITPVTPPNIDTGDFETGEVFIG